MQVQIIKAPLDIGAGIEGCKEASDQLYKLGLKDFSKGNLIEIPFDSKKEASNTETIALFAKQLADATYQTFKKGDTPLVIGGDHSIAIGSLAGIARYMDEINKPLFVLWIDAHADYNTPATSPSGNIHGMPVAVLTGEGDPALLEVVHRHPALKKENIYMLGIRDIDVGEEARLKESQIIEWRMPIVRSQGVKTLIKGLIERVKAANGHLHISFDVDGLDPKLAPAVGTPVDNGLSIEEVETCFQMIGESRIDFSCEIVEYNPTLAGEKQTATVVLKLMKQLLQNPNDT